MLHLKPEGQREGTLDLREKATYSREENNPHEVGGIHGKDITERGRREELRIVIVKVSACEENLLVDRESSRLERDGCG